MRKMYVNRLVLVVQANVGNFLLNETERNVETSVTVLNSLHGSWSTFNKRSVNSGRTQANTQPGKLNLYFPRFWFTRTMISARVILWQCGYPLTKVRLMNTRIFQGEEHGRDPWKYNSLSPFEIVLRIFQAWKNSTLLINSQCD